METVEIFPQSIANIDTVILKPRYDHSSVRLMGEKAKANLFSKVTSKPKPEEILLIGFEKNYEPYLIIGGKYSIDYCKKHPFVLNVDDKLNQVYVAGQTFKSEQLNQKAPNNASKITGEEQVHFEKESFIVLDRMGREISPEKIPFASFTLKKETCSSDANFKKILIPTEIQIDFLKSKIALRPSNLAAIMKEVFEITDRLIVYAPMYELTYENLKRQQQAGILINGITGELTLIKYKEVDDQESSLIISLNNQHIAENCLCLPQLRELTQTLTAQPITAQPTVQNDNTQSKEDQSSPLVIEKNTNINENTTLGFPAKISGETFSVGDNVTAIVGDLEICSGSQVNKTLVVKGTLKIGDNCIVNGKLKALKDLIVGADSTINGDIIAGGNIILGHRSAVKGTIEANGNVQISKDATVENRLRSKATPPSSDLQLVVITEHAIATVE